MLQARCVTDGSIYSAEDFSRLPSLELEDKRQNLICIECKNAAFFRKASSSGQGACFGARPHGPDCDMAAADGHRIIDGPGDNEDVIFNSGKRIVIDLEFGAASQTNADEGDFPATAGRGVRRFTGTGPRPNADSHRRLRPLLRALIVDPNFASSSIEIEFDGRQGVPANHFFVNVSDPNIRQHLDKFHGFWGTIASAKWVDGTLWLNSGGYSSISFPLDEINAGAIFERDCISNEEALAGASILVLGIARASVGGKIYCRVDSANHMALILIR